MPKTSKIGLCPSKLDVSDQKIARYVRQMCQTKMKKMSDRARCVPYYQFITTSKRITAFRTYYSLYIILFRSCVAYASNCMLLDMHATCMHVLHVCAWVFALFRKTPAKHKIIFVGHIPLRFFHFCRTHLALSDIISCRFLVICVGHIAADTALAMPE